MAYVFLGVIFLMTLAAVLPVFLARRNGQPLPPYTKVLIVLLVPVLALALYWSLGDSQALFRYWGLKREAAAVKLKLSKIKSPNEVVNQLKTFLAENPINPQGWYLLGKLYYGQHDFKHALPALDKAHEQARNNLTYAVSYAEADFFYHGRRLTPKTKAILQSVIARHKANIGALNLLAINNYLHGHYPQAIAYWEHLLPLFSAGSKDKQFLLTMIAQAQKKEK